MAARPHHYEKPADVTGTVFDPADDTFGPIMAAIQRGEFIEAADMLADLESKIARAGKREVLVHLNIDVPAGDGRTANEIATAIEGALEVGMDDDSVRDLTVTVPLAEDLGAPEGA